MTKAHLKRIGAPRTWPIARKEATFITRPNPGMMSLEFSISISTLLTKLTKTCKNKKEVKRLLTFSEVLVYGVRRKDDKFPVSFGSTISIINKDYFRMSITEKGKLFVKAIPAKEATLKLVKIKNKIQSRKGLQIIFSDGRTLLNPKTKLKTGDSVLLTLPKQKIEKIIPFKKGSIVFFMKGSHKGKTAIIDSIEKDVLKFESNKKLTETKKDYAIAIGLDKPLITI